jgi:hypothetical protein
MPTGYGAAIDTTYGAPSGYTPIPRTTLQSDTTRPMVPPSDAIVIPGATPIPRVTRPSRTPRDTTRTTFSRDTTRGLPRDTARSPHDTTNPFTLPPDR